ncbi:MAG: hypothetical protein JO030_02740 [Candidatus Eremiobacteraeota bacterium]|nr:hypothetical protein [Candidatus Eremiobacteraeota bacterium]
MTVLVLGGTKFLGRHIVERLSAAGHRVVCFHRGRTTAALPRGVEERYGDRDGELAVVRKQRWDAIVDTSGYYPEQIRQSLKLEAGRYCFVSTVSAYADLSVAGVTEEAATIERFEVAEEAAAYGGNKAACERLIVNRYGDDATILRPGLIAGRWDPTGRFTYWCERFLRGGDVLAPAPSDRLVQVVDAADIAGFVEFVLGRSIGGTFNVVGPAVPTTMAMFLEVCATSAQRRGAPRAAVAWLESSYLLENGVREWVELPLWIADPRYAGMLQVSNARAIAAGLRLRPLEQTVETVMDWISNEPRPWERTGLSQEREASLLRDAG